MWRKQHFYKRLNGYLTSLSNGIDNFRGGCFAKSLLLLSLILAGVIDDFDHALANPTSDLASDLASNPEKSTEHCGPITEDEYWSAESGPHVITCDISIRAGSRVTIAPATVIKFEPFAEIDVRGTLNAIGTAADPIVFTSLLDTSDLANGSNTNAEDEPSGDDALGGTTTLPTGLSSAVSNEDVAHSADQPAIGDWGNIQFIGESSSESTIAYAVIRYSGLVYGLSGTETAQDAAIELSDATPTLSHISFEENVINGVVISSMTGLEEASWDNPTIVYVVLDTNIVVPESNSLQIGAGQSIKFAQHRSLSVRGTLKAIGTSDEPIHMTSLHDDTVCGLGAFGEAICDTNNDAGDANHSISPVAGDWGNLKFYDESSDHSEMAYAVIRYSGSDVGDEMNDGAILLDDASPTLRRITFESNFINGVELKGVSSDQAVVWQNPDVVHVVQGGDVTIAEDDLLRIESGTKLKFMDDTSLLVNGHLRATGTVTDPIVLTSINDSTVCGVGAANEPICNTFPSVNGTGESPKMGDWGYIRFGDASDDASIIENAMIRYSGSNRNVEINDGAIYLDNASPTLRTISFEDNYINGVELAGYRDWQTNRWHNQDVVYVLEEGDITVADGHILTIAAGVQVLLGTQNDILVDGTLVANGLVDGSTFTPVTFSSINDGMVCGRGLANVEYCTIHSEKVTPVAGDWGKIFFRDGSRGSITRSVVRYSGSADLTHDNAAIQLTNSTPTLENITFLNNQINGVSLYHLTPWRNNELTSNSVIYALHSGHLTVAAEEVFSVAPGVKLKIGNNRSLLVDGSLSTTGTLKEPVVITSLADDSICGVGAFNELICDTDGVSQSPSVGDWGSIHLKADSAISSSLNGTTLRYAGDRNGFGLMDAALLIDGGSPTISYSTFEKNYRGIEVTGASNPILICNNLEGNIDYGIYNDNDVVRDSAGSNITAFNHWWGSESGPMHEANESGDGDRVSEGVVFQPWRDDRCTALNTVIEDNRSQIDQPNESIIEDENGTTDEGEPEIQMRPLFLPMLVQ